MSRELFMSETLPSLFGEMERMSSLWNRRLIELPVRDRYPGINMFGNDDEVFIESEIPGVASEDLTLTVEADLLVLSFERERGKNAEGESLIRRERPAGKFTRKIGLPFRAESDRIEANLKNGILTIRVPRAEADRPHRVSVK